MRRGHYKTIERLGISAGIDGLVLGYAEGQESVQEYVGQGRGIAADHGMIANSGTTSIVGRV